MASMDTDRHLTGNDENPVHNEAPPRALVVDDDQLCLETAGMMLKVLGYQVDLADGPVAAQQKLTRSRYDLLLTDLQMPHMDGIKLICWLKQREKNTWAVIMTGIDQQAVSEYPHRGLVDDWLFKPMNLNQLRGVLNGLPKRQ